MKRWNVPVFNLVIEGPNGVGKSTLIDGIFKHYNYRYMCYHRGDISNFVYANKFGRPFYSTQRNIPMYHIMLICEEDELKERIFIRGCKEQWFIAKTEKEMKTISEQKLFIDAANKMSNDYDIKIFDTTGKSATAVLNEVIDYLTQRFEELPSDSALTSWNEMYKKACHRLGKDFKVVNNQPYIDGVPMMVESTLHDGTYEKYDDKRYPDNLIYAYAYTMEDVTQLDDVEKTIDFNYVINSKIKRRPEIHEYYQAFIANNNTCLVSQNPDIPKDDLLIEMPRESGLEFLANLARTNATVYCSRDLAYLELQTARLYEAILAKNIVFVDKLTDPENKILKSIHKSSDIIDLLSVTPSNICYNYYIIMQNKDIRNKILNSQMNWLCEMFNKLEKGELK